MKKAIASLAVVASLAVTPFSLALAHEVNAHMMQSSPQAEQQPYDIQFRILSFVCAHLKHFNAILMMLHHRVQKLNIVRLLLCLRRALHHVSVYLMG